MKNMANTPKETHLTQKHLCISTHEMAKLSTRLLKTNKNPHQQKCKNPKEKITAVYPSVEGSGQRALQQPAQDSWESSRAETGSHSWPVRLQLEWPGCRTSVAAVSRCRRWRRHPSSPPGSLCWHGLTAPWQGRVDALERSDTC